MRALLALAVTLGGCAVALCGCATAQRPVVAIVSAHVEWDALIGDKDPRAVHDTPFGPWLREHIGGRDVILFHGGYAKVSAAASAQYAIDRWHPSLVVNLGTAGGFGGSRRVGDIVLATDTIVYDILEQMGDPDEAIADYTTHIDTSHWPSALRSRVVLGPIVSGDRDLVVGDLPRLAAKYHASAGDWESGAIAWVATRNHTPVLILRAITDLADAPGGDATYGNTAAWAAETKRAMAALHSLLAAALPSL